MTDKMNGNGFFHTQKSAASIKESSQESSIDHRPQDFKEFIGQERIINNIKVFTDAAKANKKTLDHAIIHGPPGLGKTTIATIIANNLNANIRTISGPAISKKGDMSAILSNLQANDVLFIDEIHRMPIQIEEVMYSAMEDRKIDIVIGDGPGAKTITIPLQPFTLIGATTQLGMLSKPLLSRFGISLEMERYSNDQLSEIISRFVVKNNFTIDNDAALAIAQRCRTTPRIALRIARRIIDFATVENSTHITAQLTKHAFKQLLIYNKGLNISDITYLKFLINVSQGRPTGLDTIAAGIEEDKKTIEEAIEPFLIQEGLIQKTPKGRVPNIDNTDLCSLMKI